MKGIVVGLGSMGKRRLRLLKGFAAYTDIIGIDSDSGRRQQAASQFGIRTAAHLEEALENGSADFCFVCSPPLTHYPLIRTLLLNRIHVFTELNLMSTGYDELSEMAKNEERVLFLSSTMLYRKEINYISNRVATSDNRFNYRYHVGQYLPDWHPWEYYGDFFVGDKKTNGCRELLAIELPWITRVFGAVSRMNVMRKRLSRLEIDYDDLYHVQILHQSGHIGTIQVDLISRAATRSLVVQSEDRHIIWEGRADSLREYDLTARCFYPVNLYDFPEQNPGYADFVLENAYHEEIETFFSFISGAEMINTYSFEDDKVVLALIDEIEAV